MEDGQKKLRILVVEDESIVAMDMRNRLVSMGYEVVGIAATGENALALVADQKPDLILMDIKLKGEMDGVQTAELVRDHHDVPVIFITAFADTKTLARARITQAFGYILKPFQEREVLISIEMAVHKHSLERELRHSREWLDGTLNAISNGVLAIDPQNRLIFMNRAAELLLGVDGVMEHGSDIDSICTFHPNPVMSELARQYRMSSGERIDGSPDLQWLIMESPSGKRPVEVIRTSIGPSASKFSATGVSGPITGTVLAIRDMTEEFKAEENRTRLGAIVANSHDAIFSLDPALKVVSWNSGAERMYGYTVSEMIGFGVDKLIPDLREQTRLRELAGYMHGGKEIGQYEAKRNCRTGKSITASVSLSPIRDIEGRIVEIACIERDISAEKDYEESLVQAKLNAEEASRAKSDFLSNMSHELRTPLNSIMGMIGLADDMAVSADQGEYLKIARQSAGNLLFLINSILDFSKIEAGKMSLNSSLFDPVAIVEDCLAEMAVQAHRKSLDLLFRADPKVPRSLFGDDRCFRQIVTNLLSNGIKFTESGSVRVDLGLDLVSYEPECGDTRIIELRVRDTGIGIPTDRIDLIWHAFTQLDGSSTRSYGGTGLGLSIVRSFAELMGGSVCVESVVGSGSDFFVSLPFGIGPTAGASLMDMHPFPPGSSIALALMNPDEAEILAEQALTWPCKVRILASATELEDLASDSCAELPLLVLVDDRSPLKQKVPELCKNDAVHNFFGNRLVVAGMIGSRSDPVWRSLCPGVEFLSKPVRGDQLCQLARVRLQEGSPPGKNGSGPIVNAIPSAVSRSHQSRVPKSGDYACDDKPSGKVSRIVELFLAEAGLIGNSSCVDLENSATRFRQAIEAQGAPSVSRIFFKIILACRRDDPEGVQKELALLENLVHSGEKISEEL